MGVEWIEHSQSYDNRFTVCPASPTAAHSQFCGERSELPLHFTNFSFALASEIHDCLFPQHILNNTFLVVTLPPLTCFIFNTSAVFGWCSFIRDASKQRVSSFSNLWEWDDSNVRRYNRLIYSQLQLPLCDTPKFLSGWCDSNTRPIEPKSIILPTELHPDYFTNYLCSQQDSNLWPDG